jgi:hypothetical protein
MPSIVKGQTRSAMQVEYQTKLNPLSCKEWSALFPDHPDAAEMIDLMGACGMDDFELSSIVVRDDRGPILLLPLFITHYDLLTTIPAQAKQLAGFAKQILPALVRPKVVGVGFVEGEWGEIGFDRSCPPEYLDRAWDLALKALTNTAKKVKAQLIAFKDFTFESGKSLPMHKLKDFLQAKSMPYAQMSVPYGSVEEYLNTLDPDLRRYFKRVEKKRSDLEIIYTDEPQTWLDAIYQLYEQQVSAMDMSFGVHRKEYFAQVCKRVPGAHYVLYFRDNQLIGFELLVARGQSLIQKYIGIDRDLGHQYKLFFLSWLQNIRYCVEHGITHTHVGASCEKLKTDLGANLIPSAVLVRHMDPIMNRLFKLAISELEYTSEVPVDPPPLGSMWPKNGGGR